MRRIPFIVGGRSVSFATSNHGLGNRFLYMGCGLSLATEMNYSPIMFWVPDNEVGRVNFGDLFESTNLPFELVEGLEAQIMRVILFRRRRAYPSLLKRLSFRLFRSLVLLQYDKRIVSGIDPDKDYAESIDKMATELLSFRRIALANHFFVVHGCDLSWLKPAPSIACHVTELKQQFAPNTVGIHVRGTDYTQYPPIEKMIIRMRAEVELDPNVKFFLASDGDRRTEAIITLFKDRLINRNSATRYTNQGQQDAVVDLFALAATSRIIGFRYSSFATTAALIGNKPLLRIGREFKDD